MNNNPNQYQPNDNQSSAPQNAYTTPPQSGYPNPNPYPVNTRPPVTVNGGPAKTSLTVPFIITLVASVLLIVSMFLPYISMDYISESHSMAEYAEEYLDNSDEILEYGSDDEVFGLIFCLLLLGIISFFVLLSVIFSAAKLPIPLLIFTILTAIFYGIQNLMYYSVYEDYLHYNLGMSWGAGFFLFYVALAINFVGAIWMIILKSKAKKAAYMEMYRR